MSDLMKLIGDYAEQRVASSLLVQDRDADAAESFAIEDRLVREITDAHAAEIRRAKAEALRDEAARIKETALATSFPGAVYTEHAVYRAHGCRLLLEAAERIEAGA